MADTKVIDQLIEELSSLLEFDDNKYNEKLRYALYRIKNNINKNRCSDVLKAILEKKEPIDANKSKKTVSLDNICTAIEQNTNKYPRIILIEGIIASGKSSLVRRIQEIKEREDSVLIISRSVSKNREKHKTAHALCKDCLDNKSYDCIIIEDAQQISIAYVLVAASLAKKEIYFVGDYMQSGPVFHNSKGKVLNANIYDYYNITRNSILSNNKCNLSYVLNTVINSSSLTELMMNSLYRGLGDICKSNNVSCDNNDIEITLIDCSLLSNTLSGKKVNYAINFILRKIIEETAEDILIITKYKDQQQNIDKVISECVEEKKTIRNIKCETVDKKGDNRSDVLVIDFSWCDGLDFRENEDVKIINEFVTELSRIKKKLIIIADLNYLINNSPYSENGELSVILEFFLLMAEQGIVKSFADYRRKDVEVY